jgi:hypothetical protein
MDSFVSQLVRKQRNDKVKSWGMRAKMKVSSNEVEAKRVEARARRCRQIDGRHLSTLISKVDGRGTLVVPTSHALPSDSNATTLLRQLRHAPPHRIDRPHHYDEPAAKLEGRRGRQGSARGREPRARGTSIFSPRSDRPPLSPPHTTTPTTANYRDTATPHQLALEAHRYPISAHNGIKTEAEMVAFRSATPRQRLYLKRVPVRVEERHEYPVQHPAKVEDLLKLPLAGT